MEKVYNDLHLKTHSNLLEQSLKCIAMMIYMSGIIDDIHEHDCVLE